MNVAIVTPDQTDKMVDSTDIVGISLFEEGSKTGAYACMYLKYGLGYYLTKSSYDELPEEIRTKRIAA